MRLAWAIQKSLMIVFDLAYLAGMQGNENWLIAVVRYTAS
jgi:hypothetical protein